MAGIVQPGEQGAFDGRRRQNPCRNPGRTQGLQVRTLVHTAENRPIRTRAAFAAALACLLVGLAVAPYMPGMAPRILAQLGFPYPYAPDGNLGPPLAEELEWGAHATVIGKVSTPEPLFPRLDTEAAADPA